MKTTVEIPDQLFRQAEEQAARDGRKLEDLMTEGLRQVLTVEPASPRPTGRRVEFPIIKRKPGAPPITQEMVDRAEEQMLKEEAEYHAQFMRR